MLNLPVAAATTAVSTAAVAWSLARARSSLGERMVPLAGMMGACVFAAQMVKFPILPGTAGHLMGGTLAALVLGPWVAMLVMTVVVLLQCLVYYDGGLTVLGANVLNLGIIGPWAGYAGNLLIRRLFAGARGQIAGATLGGWLGVALAAVVCAVQLACSGTFPMAAVLPAMAIVHSAIGLVEGLLTGLVVSFLLRAAPELLYQPTERVLAPASWRRWLPLGLATGMAVAVFLSPLGSRSPDGLESVAGALGFRAMEQAPPPTAVLADYTVPGWRDGWLAASLAGGIGVVASCGIAWALVRAASKQEAGR